MFASTCRSRAVVVLLAVSLSGASLIEGEQPGRAEGPQHKEQKPSQSQTLTKAEVETRVKNIFASMPNVHFSKGIPKNFPLPAYNLRVVSTAFDNSTKGPPKAVACIITKDSPEQVFQWYREQCKSGNWVVQTPTDKFMDSIGKKGKFYMLTGRRGNEQVKIYCLRNKRVAGTTVNIMWERGG